MENLIAAPQDTGTNQLNVNSEGSMSTQQVQSDAQNQGLPMSGRGTSGNSFSNAFSQPAIKRAMPAIIALLTIVVFLLIYSWSQVPPYRTVFPGMSEADRQSAFEALSTADYGAKIDTQSGELKVPASRYHEARLYLSSMGLPKSAALGGIESLSQDNAMTTSQFMEQVRYVSVIERELALSISKIASIKSARVHLASPKQSVFVRNRVPAKASVVVAPYPGRTVSDSQVQAIVHLVASSVPYLATEDVAVVNERGQLLTKDNRFTSMQMNAEQVSHKERLEENYRSRIEAFLSPVVGVGNVRSEVDVQIDFTEIESTFEEYDGNDKGPLVRSEVRGVEQSGNSSAPTGVPGLSGNQPFDAADSASGNLSSQSTRNYEMDRAVRHVRRQGGTLERISVAVVLNPPVTATTDDGENTAPQAGYSEAEILRFTDLVKGVVGFDEARGDVVTIVSARFEETQVLEEISEPWYDNGLITGAIKNLGLAIMFIVVILFVIRPVITTYTAGSAAGGASAGEANIAALQFNKDGAGEASPAAPSMQLSAGSQGITEEMLDTANTYDNKVALVRMLVSEDSGRVANVLKKMIKNS
ncbi:flagellar basal-body MS-ring/collar protein FliF [Porticoccaceae bacterium]|nr:flagellar basal-body MS-ring/collar protein FliF [Porticoccaceae bacterium]MDB2635378.1 flagellar basal-body MS-ring/collar protein FliF [Porticoccaceae bacterium]MDB2664637.1 flagellar basal-body MS-ring/collar protein FliF [Porticoccaceae bacterium]